jgi:hypothetical protein
MGTKVYNNLPKFLKEIDNYKAFKKELKLFLLLQSTIICMIFGLNKNTIQYNTNLAENTYVYSPQN